MTYRFLDIHDAQKIYEFESASFLDGWNENQLTSSFNSGRYYSIGAIENGEIISFIGFSVSLDTADIETICTKKEFRKQGIKLQGNTKQGIASELILRAEKFLKGKNVNKIFLEVRESNMSAINLYKKKGFNKISERKKYYSDGEDAIIMQKEI